MIHLETFPAWGLLQQLVL